MGTSAGSKGSPSGRPLVPDWVPDVSPLPAPPEKAPEDDAKPDKDSQKNPADEKDKNLKKDCEASNKPVPEIAPRGRYGATRGSIGKFGSTGSNGALKSALGHFASKGMGGSGGAAKRLGGSSMAAGRTYEVLSSLRSNTTDKSGLSPKDLRNCSVREAKDRIIEAIQPVDGSQDTESVRESLNQAIGDMLEIHEDASLDSLNEEQFDTLISSFIAHEIYSHFMLEVGETLLAKGGSEGVERANDVLDYIKAEVGRAYATFETRPTSSKEAAGISNSVIAKTFSIFEGYIQ